MCGGGKNQTTTSQVTIPPEILARYNSIYGDAQKTASTPFQSYSNDPSKFVAGLNSTEQKGMSDIAGAGGTAQLGALNVDQYMNPYVKDVAKSTMDLMTQQNEQEMSGQKGNAVAAGANFGDRSGVAAANLARQQQLGSASAISNIFNTGFNQAQGVAQQQQGADLGARQADLARQLGVGQSEMQAGQVQQNTDQAGLSALYNQFQQQRAYPFQVQQWLAQMAQGFGSLSGSTTTSTKPAGFFSGFAEGGAVEDRTGLAAGGPQGFDPNAGVYGLGLGVPGSMGYVPTASQPVGHLMIANAPVASNSSGVSDVLGAASKIEDIAKKGPETWQSMKDVFSSHASGGAVRSGLAAGGLPYDDNSAGYVPDNSPSKVPQLAVAKEPDDQSGGGLGDVIKAGADIAKIISLFNKGGRVGLDAGGDPQSYSDWAYGPDGLPLASTQNAPRGPASEQPTKAPTDGSWTDWLQHAGANLGLAEDKPVAEIRKEAYSNTPPNVTPKSLNTDVASGLGKALIPANNYQMDNAPDQISSGSLPADAMAHDPSKVSAFDRFAHNAGAGLYNSFVSPADKSAMIKPWDAPVEHPQPVSGVAATPSTLSLPPALRGLAAVPPDAPAPQQASPTFAPLLDGSGKLNADYSNPPMIGAKPVMAVPPTGLAAANTMNPSLSAANSVSQVPFAKSTGNAFGMSSELMTNGEGLSVDTREPGRPTLAGFELKQYQANNPNIRSFNDVTPRDIAVTQKSWFDGQGGDQIAKKYGPNFAAAYVNLSMLNPNVAKLALDQSGGDQNKFFGIVAQHLQGIAENKVKQGFPDYTNGWMNRVADSQKVANGAASTQMASIDNAPPAQGLARAAMAPQISPAGGGAPAPTGLAAAGDYFQKNKSTILPILTGLGAMASSPSRFLGTALLQGVGAGANAYQQYPKLQADIALQQANARNTSAVAQGQNITNLQNAIHFQPGVGNMIAITQPDGTHTLMRLTDYQNLPDPKPSPWTGGTDGTAPAPSVSNTNAQNSGVSAMPSPAPANIQMPDGVSFSPEAKKAASSDVAGSSGDYEGDKARAAEYFTNVNNSAIAARDNVPYTKQLVGSLIAANRSGTSGNLFTQTADATNYRNSIARLAGINLPEQFLESDDAQAIAHKIGLLQAGERAKTGSQNSFAALDSFLGANPNPGMPPKAAAEIAAQIMTDQQKAQDRSDWVNAYRGSGGNGAMQAADQFSKDNGPEKYAEDQRQLQKMILEIDPQTKKNFFDILSSTSGTAAQMKEALNAKGYSPSLARYFMTGR